MARTPALEFLAPATLAGERLDRAIAALAPGVSRGEARRLIAAGVVFVYGKRTGIQSRGARRRAPSPGGASRSRPAGNRAARRAS